MHLLLVSMLLPLVFLVPSLFVDICRGMVEQLGHLAQQSLRGR